MATVALKIKIVTIPKGGLGCTAEVRHPIWDVGASGLSCTRLADFLASLAVIRLGRCRASRPWTLPSLEVCLQYSYGEELCHSGDSESGA